MAAEKHINEYFQAQYGQRIQKLLQKFPSQEEEALSPYIRLLDKRKEADVVHQAMLERKEEFNTKIDGFNYRWDELQKKEILMKEYLLNFDEFIKENDQKRGRALKKASKEREVKRQKEKDLQNLLTDTERLRVERANLSRKLKKYSIFNEYLEKVVEVSDEFQEVRDVISRYFTLVATYHDLLQIEQEAQEVIERARARLTHFVEEKSDTILQYNNELSVLQTRLDHAQSEAIVWESRWAHIQNTAAKKTLLLGTIKMATLNLFQSISKEVKERVDVNVEDTARQLEVIKEYLVDLSEIWNEMWKEQVSEGTSYYMSGRREHL
ncbi:coiled-coil domain-containing protein 42 [Ambystoma mexicanum]|uniref:coiled-coil domain-containing protein 42 n=1 Tax=Ambystoma mexicanum TaxID=8296 RepID=UPI0037E9019E